MSIYFNKRALFWEKNYFMLKKYKNKYRKNESRLQLKIKITLTL